MFKQFQCTGTPMGLPEESMRLVSPPTESPYDPISISPEWPDSRKLAWFQHYFRPHFDEWVVGPINRLVPERDALIGFIFMACVIDYLASFWWGESTKKNVGPAYTGFIDEYFPKGKYDSLCLYEGLRNGLVHLFAIKNKKYALTHEDPALHLKETINGRILLNAGNFRDDLISAKDHYFLDVERDPKLLNKLVTRYCRDGFLDACPINID